MGTLYQREGGRRFGDRPESSLEGSHLCRASAQGEAGLVKALVEQLDVPVDSRGRCGLTALHCASLNGHKGVVLYLLSRKADTQLQEDSDGMMALHLTAWCSDVDIARCLLNHGADVNGRTFPGHDREGLRTALHIASEQGCVEMCQYLLGRGAKVDQRSIAGLTALHFACSSGQASTVACLLTRGADPNATTSSGGTPLLMATDINGKLEAVQLLVQQGAKVDASCDGMTPLTNACRLRHVELVRYLAQHGADVNYARNGCPALVKAIYQDHEDVVRCLVENGADVNKRDRCDGQTPLDTASERGHLHIASYLLSKGAKVNAKFSYQRRLKACLSLVH